MTQICIVVHTCEKNLQVKFAPPKTVTNSKVSPGPYVTDGACCVVCFIYTTNTRADAVGRSSPGVTEPSSSCHIWIPNLKFVSRTRRNLILGNIAQKMNRTELSTCRFQRCIHRTQTHLYPDTVRQKAGDSDDENLPTLSFKVSTTILFLRRTQNCRSACIYSVYLLNVLSNVGVVTGVHQNLPDRRQHVIEVFERR